jgi:maltooligosyltrehalose trehalohydrolase
LSAELSASRPLGATRIGDNDWSFVVWAPHHQELSVRVLSEDDGELRYPLERCDDGYFTANVPDLGGMPDYWYVAADDALLADPVSRWQPAGVHGPSRGFDPTAFDWTDEGFSMPPLSQTVIYELHVGTFTPAGTFDGAIDHLDELVDLGVTAVEPMPIAAFPGTRNWGYDGVFPFAVQDSYGGPYEFQRFVDACHQRGLAVILDVVYNHLGPEGNVLGSFGPYFTDVYATPWGAAVNLSEAGSDEVRRYFTANAMMWLRDFHVDGLRLDAIHGIVDPTASPFLRELTATVEQLATDLARRLVLIAESADNNPLVVAAAEVGGLGFDAQWNDDFHHSLHVALTGERSGYYQDYNGVADLARAFTDGFVYEGQHSTFRGRRHGAPSRSIPRDRFVVFAQNHDQIGNRAGAERLTSLVEAPAARLAAAAVLLSPFVPMLFMGEEYGETAPFPYFVSHGDPELIEAVRAGRAREFGRDADQLDPASEAAFDAAQLDRSRRETSAGHANLALCRALTGARRQHRVLTEPMWHESEVTVNGGVLAIVSRSTTNMALVALNFGSDADVLEVDASASHWLRRLDSGDPELGGDGVRCPAKVAAADRIPLAGCGFCLYVSAMPEGTT